jgi:DNA-binding MarR family transcriptional regulator
MRILSFFNEQDIIHISEISRTLGLSIQNVNNIVRRLEDADYVTRTTNKTNRRFSDIQLTPHGRKQFTLFRSMQLDTLARLFDCLEAPETKDLLKSLNKAAGILEKAYRKEKNQ